MKGSVLDWVVAWCQGLRVGYTGNNKKLCYFKTTWEGDDDFEIPKYSSDWVEGGKIIDQHRFQLRNFADASSEGAWASIYADNTISAKCLAQASVETVLIAAIRCYIMSVLGASIEIPDYVLNSMN